jgi:hypothetical protein
MALDLKCLEWRADEEQDLITDQEIFTGAKGRSTNSARDHACAVCGEDCPHEDEPLKTVGDRFRPRGGASPDVIADRDWRVDVLERRDADAADVAAVQDAAEGSIGRNRRASSPG